MKTINFKYYFDKLEQPAFISFHGNSNKIQQGENVKVMVENIYVGVAFCWKIQHMKIKDISLVLLKRETSINGKTIESHADFVKELNKTWPRVNVTLETTITLLYLQKKTNFTNNTLLQWFEKKGDVLHCYCSSCYEKNLECNYLYRTIPGRELRCSLHQVILGSKKGCIERA